MIIILKVSTLSLLIYLFYKIIGFSKVKDLKIYDLIITIILSYEYILIIFFKESFLKIFFITIIIFIIKLYLTVYQNDKKEAKEVPIYEKRRFHYLNILKYNLTIFDLINFLKESNLVSFKETKKVYLTKGILYEKKDEGSMLLINDGKINYQNLTLINKDKSWLLNSLSCPLDEVVLGLYKNNNLYIIKS